MSCDESFHHVSRRSFFAASAILAVPVAPALAGAPSSRRSRQEAASETDSAEHMLDDAFPSAPTDLVRGIVGASHVNFDRVKELVGMRPELAKAAYDWGFGDWESALGAASHMGRRDIADFLIAHGARPNLFTFAMMGQVDVVRAVCTALPGIQSLPGPHMISLLQHARHGGDDASLVVEYLETLGGADSAPDDGPEILELSEADAGVYVGTYVPKGAADSRFVIAYNARNGVATFQRDEGSSRFLRYLGDHTMMPSGAPSVRLKFSVAGGRASGLTIHEGNRTIVAARQ